MGRLAYIYIQMIRISKTDNVIKVEFVLTVLSPEVCNIEIMELQIYIAF